jgi:hypothetical protein
LEFFWTAHDSTALSYSRQYKGAVFFHNDAQQRLANETRNREATRKKAKIFTEILPFNGFYLAEEYHQKYYLKMNLDLMREFTGMYPDEGGLINSTAAARINGYVAGYGAYETLLLEVGSFGLSREGSKKLVDLVYSSGR